MEEAENNRISGLSRTGLSRFTRNLLVSGMVVLALAVGFGCLYLIVNLNGWLMPLIK
jgi:hypothetical protein